jgi:SAM-dependent methyltransferase
MNYIKELQKSENGSNTHQADLASGQNSFDVTIQYYEEHAEEFAANTLGADMASIRSRFLAYLPTGCMILDFGCGTGRDSKAFLDLGYDVTAIDGSEALCKIAQALTGLSVRCLDFRRYTPANDEIYEGIWACASLLHLQKGELLPVMKVLSQALKPEGAFYVSFKYGTFEGERNGRHFTDFTLEEFREFIKSIPELSVAEYWVTGDVRPGRGDERWLNIVLQRTMICK